MFVSLARLKLVLTVLIPALIYVFCVQYVGLYVASAVYIAVFMVWLGKYSWLKSISVGVLVNVSFFLMFEVWFKVPLWKGCPRSVATSSATDRVCDAPPPGALLGEFRWSKSTHCSRASPSS